MIYLDNSATTRLDEEVLEAMLPWLRDEYGNASSIYSLGRHARVAIEDARSEIAALINAHPAEIIFTSGGTEANNLIVKSCCIESGLTNRIACGATEHHAVLEPVHWLGQHGVTTNLLRVDSEGRVAPDTVRTENATTTLVSVMHANNETGVINDLKALRDSAPDVYFHTDAVQSFGKIPVDVEVTGIDFMSMSAHKIHGPKGVGAVFIRKGIDFKAHQQGGAQERNRRAGTEPVSLIVGFAVAARAAVANMHAVANRMHGLTSLFRKRVVAHIENINFNTPEFDTLPNVVNVSFPDARTFDGDAILQGMDLAGVAVSNGSACVSGSLQPSHVLLAMGRGLDEARAAVRISVSKYTTDADVEKATAILADVVRGLRQGSN